MTATTTVPRWRPAPRAKRLASVAACALAAAFLAGHGELLALAAGPLVLLAVAGRLRPPRKVVLTATVDPVRCVEGDPVTVTVTVDADAPLDALAAQVVGPPSLATTPVVERAGTLTTKVVPGRWGAQRLAVRITALTTWRLRQAELDLDLGVLTVLPRAPRLRTAPAQRALLARLGEHPSRAVGAGIEFAGIREYQPGDQIRDLNWPATSRRRRPLVNERASERAADLVVAVDTFTDLATAAGSTVDISVRGAVALAQAGLRHRDRVGLVVLGGVPRWLTPASGQRQFYRIADAVLSARVLMLSVVRPDVTRLPRPALPPGALVVLFSPLVDERVFAVLGDLRQRRVRSVVVDVLGDASPPAGRGRRAVDPLAVRLWRLDRKADRLALAQLGVPVVAWPPGEDLPTALAPLTVQRPGRAA
jgi:uncharacterized protein (DUF58 family)